MKKEQVLGYKFAIRNAKTGGFLPAPKGRCGRGGSHLEPLVPLSYDSNTYPRLFDTKRSAQNALNQWLKGKHTANYEVEQESWEMPAYQVQVGTNIEPVPSRIKEDMVIETIQLVAYY